MFLVRRIIIQYAQMTKLVSKNITVKKMRVAKWLVVLLLAGAAQVPVVAESPAAKPNVKCLSEIEAIYQKGLAARATGQITADQARDALAKEEASMKAAIASGDKKKIKTAEGALLIAKGVVLKTSEALNRLVALVDRLNVLNDKAKILSKEGDLEKLENLLKKASTVWNFIREPSKPCLPIIIVVPPPCTTTTTQPSPTPVGRRG
jgi:hypothetical protein